MILYDFINLELNENINFCNRNKKTYLIYIYIYIYFNEMNRIKLMLFSIKKKKITVIHKWYVKQ